MIALQGILHLLDSAYGYEVGERIYTGKESLIYKGTVKENNQPVVIKVMRSDYPAVEQLKKFEREFAINQELALEDVVRAYRLLSLGKTKAIIMEDFGGVSLEKLNIAGKQSIKNFLVLAMGITGILQQVHSRYIVHKDLKPHNILMNPQNSKLKLIDFGMASRLSKEKPEILEQKLYEGTFQYMPPEQARSLKEPIDFRADLYSLGVTFYELLTGQLPFCLNTKEKLIHAHIAKLPQPPETIRPDIPGALSAVILKLMEKMPARRYQSCRGLLLDLEKCLRRLSLTGKIEYFIPGSLDIPMIFHIPPKLYAREAELNSAKGIYDSLTKENKKCILIRGNPGIGKSTLVKEFEKEIALKKGYFISGKFDQSRQMSPYSALIDAITAFVDQLMVEPDKKLSLYRKKLMDELGSAARVICDLVPHMKIITGPLPEAPVLPPEQTKNRLHMAFQKLLSIAPELTTPIIFFIDDLQWADDASLELLHQTLTDPEITHFLFIGTYRNEEPNINKALSKLLREIIKSCVGTLTIALKPLSRDKISQMLTETFYCSPKKAASLRDLLYHKTGGNPFFIKLFLKTLYTDGLIRFDGNWIWDIKKIIHQTATSNVVAHLQQSIKKLDLATQETLKLASCYGNSFNIEEFCLMINKPEEKFTPYLFPATQRGYLIKDGNQIHFVHDKIREAAYNLIPVEMKIYLHYRIGKTLSLQKERGFNKSLFEKINHLNKAIPLLSDNDIDHLLTLNILAGKKAKAAGAFSSAETFFLAARQLLRKESWDTDYKRTLELLTELAETRIALVKYEEIHELFHEITGHTRSIKDKTKITVMQILCSTARDLPEQAISEGIKILKESGFSFRETPSQQDVEDLFDEVEKQIQKMDLKEFFNRAVLTGTSLSTACMIIEAIGAPLFFTAPLLFTETLLAALKEHLEKKELCESSLYIISCYGVTCMGFGKQNSALKIINALDANLNRFHNNIEKSKYLFIKTIPVLWAKPPRQLKNDYNEALKMSLETGNNEFASNSYFYMFLTNIISGTSLGDIKKWSEIHFREIKKLKYKWMISYFSLYRQGTANLLGETADFGLIKGEFYDESKELKDPGNLENVNFHLYYTFIKVLLLYLSDKEPPCLPLIEKLEVYETSFACQPFYTAAKLLFSLVISRLYLKEKDETAKAQMLNKLKVNAAQFKHFALQYDEVKGSKFRLMQAELLQLKKGHHEEILRLYDRSIEESCKNENIYEAAMANECAARYLYSRNDSTKARTYLKEAIYFYDRWGCSPKVKQLEAKYGFYPYEVLRNFKIT